LLRLKKILYPIDFSEPSRKALKAASELAEKFSAELYVLHVMDPIPTTTATSGAVPPVAEPAKQTEHVMHNSITEVVAEGIQVHPMVVHGSDAEEILKAAKEMKIDLIIIATHGASGWKNMTYGAVLEKVIRRAKRNVLIVYSKHEKK
jgi:nucleotide-binding universal stress UspA family protein